MIPASAPPGEFLAIFWRMKLRLGLNYLRNIKRHVYVHIVVGSVVLTLLLGGGYLLFSFLFSYLLKADQQPFGEPLMKRLVGMVLLAFFSMLTFSNLIIMLTTTYISREVEFYMGSPVAHRRLFFCKLGESTLYSSWAFLILSMPFFLALGATAIPAAPLGFYPITALMLIPYVTIPSAVGASLTLLLTSFVPAKKTFRLAATLAGLAIASTVITGRFAGAGRALARDNRDEISRVMNLMGVGDAAWSPSTWLARGLRAAAERDWPDALFWGGMLLSTALMAIQICYWLSGWLYYKGFCESRTSGSTERKRARGLYGFFDSLARPIRPAIRALVVKDFAVFWRDPAQWGQLMVLFGLLLIYIINLRWIANLSRMPISKEFWQPFISLLNIGAICFVLSILSTRFFYPMLSLEGKQQWVIGLAPLGRTQLVWVKYGVCWISSLALTLPLILLSCVVLNVTPGIAVISIATVLVMSLGLTSLAIGLGAFLPNFLEDNPARIANGLGGTLNVVLSLIYIGLGVALEAPLLWVYVSGTLPEHSAGRWLAMGSAAAWVFVHALAILLPMRVGLANWRRLQF